MLIAFTKKKDQREKNAIKAKLEFRVAIWPFDIQIIGIQTFRIQNLEFEF